jgi:DNA-binding transcriptional regulator YbjK
MSGMSPTYHRLGQLIADAKSTHGEDESAVISELYAQLEADPALINAIVREGGLAHMMKRMGRFLTLLSEYVLEGEKEKRSVTEQQIEELWERAL